MLFIVGAGGHGSDVADLAIRCGVRPHGALDDDPLAHDRLASRGVPVRGGIRDLPDGATFTLGIGYPQPRVTVTDLVNGKAHGPLVDPSAVVSPVADLADGVQVFWQAAVSPLAQLGRHTLVSYGATIGHDSVIGDFSMVMPGAHISGDVTIGERTLIGTGATILQGLEGGDDAAVGAGAVVVHDVPSGVTAIGVPARWR